MSLFSSDDIDKINKAAKQSTKLLDEKPKSKIKTMSITAELEAIYEKLTKYFSDSEAILISTTEELDKYVDNAIKAKYVGIDTETTGLDRQNDTIVGMSLYFLNGVECYIPNKHKVPIFDEPYSGQLSYEDCQRALQKMIDGGVKFVFANADFDLAMIYKDYKIDLLPNCYYDVILAWRCLKENEPDNRLKTLYNKYVNKGKGDPMQFSDFFPVHLFPYAKPEYAKLYAANDPKITLKLFLYQMNFMDKSREASKKHKLDKIADLYWGTEMPMVAICQQMHRDGIYVDSYVTSALKAKYKVKLAAETKKLQEMVQNILDTSTYVTGLTKPPFVLGKEFNCNSPLHVKHLLYKVMQIAKGPQGESTDKTVLGELNLPITKQILAVRSLHTLINTFVDKLPRDVARDGRIHARFNQIGADTGRMSSAEPNLQNVPANAADIRHMFRATLAEIETIHYDTNIVLKYYDSIKVSSGEWMYADMITPGTQVYDSKSNLHDVVDVKLENGKATLALNVDLDTSIHIPVMHSPYVMLSSDYS